MNHHESGYTMGDDERVGELLEILTTQHCRPLLQYFREASDEVASVSELADEVSEEEPERVKIQLQHSTLPRLSEMGVVDYDTRTDMVRYQGHSDLETLLDAITKALPTHSESNSLQ